jgi:A/G-specific adenine glycosylase
MRKNPPLKPVSGPSRRKAPAAPVTNPAALSMAAAAACFAKGRAPLRRWFRTHARTLPWRQPYVAGNGPGVVPAAGDLARGPQGPMPRRPPYAVWISEIMLQQTVVAAVIPHFERWMRLFPDVAALAAAPGEKVLQAWAGLGYYARARNLHKGAKALVARGSWPDTAREWRDIPGVGEYTSGAVASFAFGRREPVLDGNVARVFSRLLGLAFLPGGGAAAKRAYWELARQWADVDRPGEVNEALMELGALVCVPGTPRCGACPLSAACAARGAGWQAILPPAKKRVKPDRVPAAAVVAVQRGRVLAEERAAGAFLAGHVMFPLFLNDEAGDWRAAFRRRFPGLEIAGAEPAGRLRHAIMAKRYDVEVWKAALRRNPARGSHVAPAGEARWVPESEVAAGLTNSLARKIWKAARDASAGGA